MVSGSGGGRPEAIAVCLLHSYANADHEQQLAGALRAAFDVPVSVSSEVLPEYREFERWSTTVLNAYVAPLMAGYLERLAAAVTPRRLRIMQSNGGALSAQQARHMPARTVLSGPAGGAVGALAVGRRSGYAKVIGFDMGGTSTDVTLIDGAVGVTSEASVGDIPVRLPMIDIHTVGAGGGSLAWIDTGGALRVGPRSAGAVPGPACYGTGDGFTVTDANLLLGRLDPSTLLAGGLRLDVERALRAAEVFGRSLGLDPIALSAGVLRVANAAMERAIRVVSVEKGIDPRGFALLAFGGAGGMHACALADALEMDAIIVPRYAGVLSALGMVVADTVRDYSRSVLTPLPPDASAMADWFEPLEAQARADLELEGFAAGDILVERERRHALPGPGLRDHGAVVGGAQGSVRCAATSSATGMRIRSARSNSWRFACGPLAPRRRSTGRRTRQWTTPRFPLALGARGSPAPSRTPPSSRRPSSAPVTRPTGPCIIAGPQATTVVAPGWRFRVDDIGSVVVTR